MSKSTMRRRNSDNNQVLETKIEESNKEDVLLEQLNFEIECPRCNDVMELSSKFDRMSYYCRSCRLELNVH